MTYDGPDPYIDAELREWWKAHPEFYKAASKHLRSQVEGARLLRRCLGLLFTSPQGAPGSEQQHAFDRRVRNMEHKFCSWREFIRNSDAFKSLSSDQQAKIEADCFKVAFSFWELE